MMLEATAEAQRELFRAQAQSVQLTDFKRQIYRRYQHAPHLQALDELLTKVARFIETGGKEGVGRAIIAMPPRHGKSLTVSRLFPAWFLGRNPDLRVILASYGAALAVKHSRMARNLIQSPIYQHLFPGITLAQDSRAVDAWNLAHHEGGMDAMGVDGAVTGKGGHLILIDDPHKGRKEAESETSRGSVWDWYTDDLYSRLEPGGALIVTATRWHMDDLTGRILKNSPGKFEQLVLPALAGAGDPIGRAEGEALWPERYPLPVLKDIEQTQGPYGWSSEYQQRPTPAEGGIFKRVWFKGIDNLPSNIAVTVRAWDLAMSERTSADYTAGVKYALGEDGQRYIIDVAHEQIDWGNLTEFLAGVILKDGPAVVQGIEQKGYMSRAIQALNVDPRLHGYQIWGQAVDTDKLTRALPAAAKAASGVVYVLNRSWTEAFIEELCAFPNAAHDDQVDAFSLAEAMLGEQLGVEGGGINYADFGSSISESAY